MSKKNQVVENYNIISKTLFVNSQGTRDVLYYTLYLFYIYLRE